MAKGSPGDKAVNLEAGLPPRGSHFAGLRSPIPKMRTFSSPVSLFPFMVCALSIGPDRCFK